MYYIQYILAQSRLRQLLLVLSVIRHIVAIQFLNILINLIFPLCEESFLSLQQLDLPCHVSTRQHLFFNCSTTVQKPIEWMSATQKFIGNKKSNSLSLLFKRRDEKLNIWNTSTELNYSKIAIFIKLQINILYHSHEMMKFKIFNCYRQTTLGDNISMSYEQTCLG